jgi:hypothetical protein
LNGEELIPISVWEIDSRFLLLPEHRARDGAEGLREEKQWYPATRQPGDPATRRPGDPATRQPGDPATRQPRIENEEKE